jgi:uncharacterized protein (DUF433 family)
VNAPDLSPLAAPLRVDAGGVVRISSTRVTLDTLIGAFSAGCAPEEIVTKYPSLDIADVYAVIALYLRNRSEVDAYVAARDAEAARVRSEVETRTGLRDVRARLLARRPPAS